MRRGFTMVELVFVIVILGILAAIAVPRLAASRDDAAATAVKQDVTNAISYIPAWYTGQRDARIDKGMDLDANRWTVDTVGFRAIYSENGDVCVTMQIYESNATTIGNPQANEAETAATAANLDANANRWIALMSNSQPILRISKGAATGPVCSVLWGGMGLTEQNISMGGNRVVWKD